MISSMRRLLRFSEVGKTFLILLLLRSPVDYALTAYYAHLLEKSFQAIEAGDEVKLFHVFVVFLIACTCIFLYNGTVWNYFAVYTIHIEAALRKKLFRKVSELPYENVSRISTGDWITRLNGDTQMAYNLIGGALNLPHVVVGSINLLGSMIVLVHFNWVMFLMSIGITIPQILFSQYYLARPMTGLMKESEKKLSELTNWIEPIVTSADIIKIYDGKSYIYNKLNESSCKLRAANMKIHKKNSMGATIIIFFGAIGYLLLLLYGSYKISQGSMDFGELTMVLQYRGGVVVAISMLINCSIQMRGNLAGVKRINELIQM